MLYFQSISLTMAVADILKTSPLSLSFAFLLFLTTALVLTYAVTSRKRPIPEGLREPPEPSGARLISGHSHVWSGNAVSNPSEGQLVKWAREHGEIYQIWQGTERWVVLSSPEAIKVRRPTVHEGLVVADAQQEVFDRNGTYTGSRPPARVAMDILSGGYRMLFMVCPQRASTSNCLLSLILGTRSHTASTGVLFEALYIRS